MNDKEIAELRRRFRADKTSISRIRGAYVNEKREIISEMDQSVAMMTETEADEILSLLKKTLSGKVDTNLLDIHFTTQQVMESPEHKLLCNRSILKRALAVGVVVADGSAVSGRLGNADRPRDRHLEELVRVVFFYFVCHLN